MPYELRSDTIAAIATARGIGGIGVIRLSGDAALSILDGMFRKNPKDASGLCPSRLGGSAGAQPPVVAKVTAATKFQPRRLTHGWILDAEGRLLDEVLAVFMPGPRSFSGEDTAELHCHGGRAVLEAALESALARGARLARPGEFTQRAYLNGRLDLSQAEAVHEMITAPTKRGVYLARNKLEGKLGLELDELRRRLDSLRARLLVELDFPDEAAEENGAGREDFAPGLQELEKRLSGLLEAYERARIWREGALAVLAGAVNVGKSSLLNALLGRRRALVSEVPGTTRDFIEESLNLDGLPVRLVDTAGLRRGGDAVEAEGMALARELFGQADLILLLLDDAPRSLTGENAEILRKYPDKVLIVLNKSDLRPGAAAPRTLFGRPASAVSAKTGAGLNDLCAALYRELTLRSAGLDFELDAPPTLRQRHLLAKARAEIRTLAEESRAGLHPDLLSVRLDAAAALLEEVIGLASGEEILDEVFSGFCLGK